MRPIIVERGVGVMPIKADQPKIEGLRVGPYKTIAGQYLG